MHCTNAFWAYQMRRKMAASENEKKTQHKLDGNHQCSRFLIYFICLSVFSHLKRARSYTLTVARLRFHLLDAQVNRLEHLVLWQFNSWQRPKTRGHRRRRRFVFFLQYLCLYNLLLLLKLSRMCLCTVSHSPKQHTLQLACELVDGQQSISCVCANKLHRNWIER